MRSQSGYGVHIGDEGFGGVEMQKGGPGRSQLRVPSRLDVAACRGGSLCSVTSGCGAMARSKPCVYAAVRRARSAYASVMNQLRRPSSLSLQISRSPRGSMGAESVGCWSSNAPLQRRGCLTDASRLERRRADFLSPVLTRDLEPPVGRPSAFSAICRFRGCWRRSIVRSRLATQQRGSPRGHPCRRRGHVRVRVVVGRSMTRPTTK